MMNEDNEKLILNPEFIPFYPAMFRAWFLAIDCILYWFIRFFLVNNDKFYCTDKQIWDMLGLSIKTISRSFKKLKESGFIKTEYRNTKWGWKSRIVELEKSNGHGWPFMNGHGWPYIENKYLYSYEYKYMSDSWTENTQTSVKKGENFTKEQEEQFERVWKNYPQKTGKQEAKKYFLKHNYADLLLEANIVKRQVILGITTKKYVRWWNRWMRDFTPQLDALRQQDLKEIFEKHMTIWGDMKKRMEDLKSDFPEVDFEQLYKERSNKRTENAIWALIHWK